MSRVIIPWLIAMGFALYAADARNLAKNEKQRELLSLKADSQEWVKDRYWRGEGNVQLRYRDVTVSCDRLMLDLETMQLEAEGNVLIDQGPQRLLATRAKMDLDKKTGWFENVSGTLEGIYYFTADRLERLDETHYFLEHATFTSCETQEGHSEPWRFTVRKALLEMDGYGHFYGAGLQIRRAPIFYFPYFLWPLKSGRTAGLLVPTFGYSKRRGAYVGDGLFLPLGRSYDVTLLFDLYSLGTIGTGTRWRWAPKEEAYGEAELFGVWDHIGKRWEWRVDARHEQKDLMGFKVVAEAHDVSDIDFFREFERSYRRNTLRSLYSYVFLSKTVGPGTLNIRADHRTTFLSTGTITMSQLPEVEFRVRPRRVGRSMLYWSLLASANVFAVHRGGKLNEKYGRLDFFPKISYIFPSPPWLSVTPRLGTRSTYYTTSLSEDRTEYTGDSLKRNYFEGGVDIVGPSFSRVFHLESGEKLKHLIEPRIEYSYTSAVGVADRVPIFDEVDSVLVTNRVRFSLVNTLFAKEESSGSRELASFLIYQDLSLREPLNRSPDGLETSKHGPLQAQLRLSPTPAWSIYVNASYDTMFSNLRSASLSASFRKRSSSLGLTWYQSFIPYTGETASSQIRIVAGSGSGKPWKAQVGLAYDAKESRFVQQRALVSYTGSCWGITFEYRDFRLGPYPTRDYRISIDFKGIGKFIEIKGAVGSPRG